MEHRVTLGISSKKANTNSRDFDFDLKGKFDWHDPEAKKYRRCFKQGPNRKHNAPKRNVDHKIESELLIELLKKSKENKKLPFMRPVLLYDLLRFQIPTSLSTSKAKDGIVKYAGAAGGEIDILARADREGRTKLCVIELKDENKSSELPNMEMKQAIACATFIWMLLRHSNKGETWWHLFGLKEDCLKA